MSKKLYTEESIADIADAIREKNGETTLYKVAEMGDAVRAIETGINPFGTIGISQNGTYDVTQYANAEVNIAEKIKKWSVVLDSNKTSAYNLMTDQWLATHYNDSNLLVYVHPKFNLPATASYAFSLGANFPLATVNNSEKHSIRGYKANNGTTISSVHESRKVSASNTQPGEAQVNSSGTVRINASSSYPLPAGTWEVVAFLV